MAGLLAPNPNQQTGGMTGMLRDLLTASSPGHSNNRMANVRADRMRDMGMAPEQLDYEQNQRERDLQARQKEQWDFEDRQRTEDAAKKKAEKVNTTQAYVDYARREMKAGRQAMGINSWLSLEPKDRSELMMGEQPGDDYSSRPGTQIQYDEHRINTVKKMEDAGASPEEIKTWTDRWDNKVRADKYFEQAGAVRKVSGGGDSESAVTGSSIEDQQADAISQQAGMTAAQESSKINVQERQGLGKNLDEMGVRMGQLDDLRDKIASGPDTGMASDVQRIWDAELQALQGALRRNEWNEVQSMKNKGMTFGDLTIGELERIAESMGKMTNKKEANLAIIDGILDEMDKVQGVLVERWNNPDKYLSRTRQPYQRRSRGEKKTVSESENFLNQQGPPQ